MQKKKDRTCTKRETKRERISVSNRKENTKVAGERISRRAKACPKKEVSTHDRESQVKKKRNMKQREEANLRKYSRNKKNNKKNQKEFVQKKKKEQIMKNKYEQFHIFRVLSKFVVTVCTCT